MAAKAYQTPVGNEAKATSTKKKAQVLDYIKINCLKDKDGNDTGYTVEAHYIGKGTDKYAYDDNSARSESPASDEEEVLEKVADILGVEYGDEDESGEY